MSTIDLAPTYLEAAGVKPPESFQGISLMPVLKSSDATVRRHAFSEHNWHDFEAHGRAVRSEGYLYIRNKRPQFAWQGPADSVRSPSHKALLTAKASNSMNATQAEVLMAPRANEELFRTSDDPNQTNNLIDSPSHEDVKKRLQSLLDQWIEETGDDAPDHLTPDGFDRETGQSLKNRKQVPRGIPAGEQRRASFVNSPGPR